MVWEGRHKQEFLKGDVYEDMDYLAILAEDYFKNNDWIAYTKKVPKCKLGNYKSSIHHF